MNKYDLRFENLISKYFDTYSIANTTNPVNLIGKIIRDKCKGKKTAIWGAGEHTINLHKYFSVEIKEAEFIIDNNEALKNKDFLGFKIISPEELKDYEMDVILISSYAGAKVIERQIEQMNLKCEVVNFYKILEQDGINLGGAFFASPSIYIELYDLKEKYNKSENIKEKEEYITKIIFLYLKIRDIYNAKMFIDEYINCGFSKSDKFKALLKDVNILVEELSLKLKNRQGKDIMLMFLDSLRAKDIYNENSPMKYLNTILDKSICFTKAYSPSIVTYESVPSMFSNSMPFINALYRRTTVNENECYFLQSAIEKGYKIKIYTLAYWNIIDGKNIQYGQESNYAAETLWNALCDLADSEEKNTLYLLYFWQETHTPHIGGRHSMLPQSHVTPFTCNDKMNQTQGEYIKQYEESLTYIDNQLGFYFDVMSENTTKIIFSDHGQIIEKALQPIETIGTLAGWHTIRCNIPLIINGGNMLPKKIDGLYSTRNLGNLISGIIDDKLDIKLNDIVEVNFSKINNSVIIQKYKEKGYEDYLYGFKFFLNEKYKMVITGNNKIKIYDLKDEFNEIEDEFKRKEIIQYFKEKKCDFSIPKFLD